MTSPTDEELIAAARELINVRPAKRAGYDAYDDAIEALCDRLEGRGAGEAVAFTGRKHDLKTWPDAFEAVRAGRKPWELRVNDRDFQIGDLLWLQEWNPETGEYTGAAVGRLVTWMLQGGLFGLPDGMVIMSLDGAPTLPDWPISTDGPNTINDHRRSMARWLMDSKFDDAEAYGCVAYHPAITDRNKALAKAPEASREGEGWREITDDQKDGRPIIAGSINHDVVEVVCWQAGNGWGLFCFYSSGSGEVETIETDIADMAGWVNQGPQKDRFYANPLWFTHYRPLPAPPSPIPEE